MNKSNDLVRVGNVFDIFPERELVLEIEKQ